MIKIVPKSGLLKLVAILKRKGYTVIAPTLKNEVIIYDEINSAEDLPQGIYEKQDKGFYRTYSKGDNTYFSYVHGPNSLKHFLHPSKLELLRVKPDLSQEAPIEKKKYAFIGVRGCDLRALEILDDVFINKNQHPDIYYEGLRENLFILAVNCTVPADTCFCTSMGTGPYAEDGYDLSITELSEGLLMRSASSLGDEILESLEGRKPYTEELEEEKRLIENARLRIKRQMETEDLPQKLLCRVEHPSWEDVAQRCLACGSCTMVCPTCFCYEVIDDINIDGSENVRFRQWDSCFREEFSAIHGVPLRQSIKARYRQWLMHKFSYWMGQFGRLGCVGCGRCIAWCPVGIDITEELKRITEDG